jgi:hypothetical protein
MMPQRAFLWTIAKGRPMVDIPAGSKMSGSGSMSVDAKKYLDDASIRNIAIEVATANLTLQAFTTVTTSSTTDSTGNDALQITVIIKPDVLVTGETALKNLGPNTRSPPGGRRGTFANCRVRDRERA